MVCILLMIVLLTWLNWIQFSNSGQSNDFMF